MGRPQCSYTARPTNSRSDTATSASGRDVPMIAMPASTPRSSLLSSGFWLDGAAPESNRPSRGLHDRTGFEDQLGHRAHAAPLLRLTVVRA